VTYPAKPPPLDLWAGILAAVLALALAAILVARGVGSMGDEREYGRSVTR
jgi:hypothetical protein